MPDSNFWSEKRLKDPTRPDAPTAEIRHVRDIEPGDVVLTSGVAAVHVVAAKGPAPVGHVLHFTDGSAMAYGFHDVAAYVGNTTAPNGYTYRAEIGHGGVTVIETAPDGDHGAVYGGNWEDEFCAVERPDGTLMSLDPVDDFLRDNGWQRVESWRVQIDQPEPIEGSTIDTEPDVLSLVASVIPA